MKKFFTILALAMVSVMSWAVSITVNPTTVDFGTVSIKGLTEVEDSVAVTVGWSGLQEYCGIWTETTNEPAEDCAFWASPDYLYATDPWHSVSNPYEFMVHYYATKAGTYSAKIHFFTYSDENWEVREEKVINVSIVVSGDAVLPTTSTYERLNSTGDLQSGDTIVFISESAGGAVCGPLDGAYLTAVTEGLTLNSAEGTAEVPEGVQTFVLNKYSGNWQFLYPDDNEKALLLDYSSNNGKGAFSTTYEAGKTVKSWEISISNGVASVIRPNDADLAYPVRFNGDRFKPYKTEATGTSIAIYKKVGSAQPIESKLEVGDVVFGDVEQDEQKSVTVNYTAENLTDDIVWAIEGTDAALFDVDDQGDRTSGTVTVTYKGTSSKTGALDARLSYLTQDIALDPMEGSKTISITLIPATVKLTGLAFEGAPETIDQGQTIDLSQYVVYTPNDAANKSLTWSVDQTYQGEVDQDGKLTAKHVTGTVTVTATSVRVPSVSASVTLTITKPTITDFTLSKTETTLNIGGQETLTITAFVPAYASESATWTSNKTTVATVNKNGVITAKALGDAEITATIGEVEKTCTVHVVAVAVNSITLPAEANVTLGSSLQLNPTVDPAQAASEYTITYVSSAPEIATVDANGKVVGVAAGDAVITATIADKSAQITIHVVGAQMFSKVTDASTLAEKDTIILALRTVPVIAGARDNKKLTVLLNDVTVTETEAYADNACRFVLGTEKNKDGYTLTIVGGKTIAVASGGNDIVDANTQNCKFWEFVADGTNGYFVRNLGNSNAMFKYHSGNAAIKPYKATTTGAVYVYAYVRKYVEPGPATDVENTEVETKAQKVLRNGQILILRGDAVYTITGVRVE